MVYAPPARHLLRAKDLTDARFFEPLDVDDMARAAGLSRAHFSREFRRAFGESPHAYLLTRRLERAASLLRMTDRSVADVCLPPPCRVSACAVFGSRSIRLATGIALTARARSDSEVCRDRSVNPRLTSEPRVSDSVVPSRRRAARRRRRPRAAPAR
jgi:hypothetical protein